MERKINNLQDYTKPRDGTKFRIKNSNNHWCKWVIYLDVIFVKFILVPSLHLYIYLYMEAVNIGMLQVLIKFVRVAENQREKYIKHRTRECAQCSSKKATCKFPSRELSRCEKAGSVCQENESHVVAILHTLFHFNFQLYFFSLFFLPFSFYYTFLRSLDSSRFALLFLLS